MSLSVRTAWDETAAFAKGEALRPLALAFLLIALPAAFLQAIAPATIPGRLPEPGLWLLLVPVSLAGSLFGALAICRLALGSGESLRAALASGLRRLPSLLGAALLVALAGFLLFAPAILLAVRLGSILPIPAALLLCAALWVRLILLTPLAASESLGPIALIGRGWALTAGSFWRLLAVLLAAAFLSLMALMAAGLVGGVAVRLAAGQPQPGTFAWLLMLLVSAVLQAMISALFTAFLARLYVQLAD